jgi:hypothetical protein
MFYMDNRNLLFAIGGVLILLILLVVIGFASGVIPRLGAEIQTLIGDQPTATAMASPTPRPTSTKRPTRTPRPTQTSLPTATAFEIDVSAYATATAQEQIWAATLTAVPSLTPTKKIITPWPTATLSTKMPSGPLKSNQGLVMCKDGTVLVTYSRASNVCTGHGGIQTWIK